MALQISYENLHGLIIDTLVHELCYRESATLMKRFSMSCKLARL